MQNCERGHRCWKDIENGQDEQLNSDCGRHRGRRCRGEGQWGGRREGAGRKCQSNKIPFNRRLSEDLILKLKNYASEHGITETEALETAIRNL